MKLHFDANQEYQLKAIQSIVNVFEGQPLNQGDFEFSMGGSGGLPLLAQGVRNELVISEEQILKNLRQVQKENDIPLSEKLDGLNFSVEMETGTGKTYVYLRTIYELNKKYGFKKFIIVTPSIAIREGIVKNLQITHDHFQTLYDKTPSTFQVYDSSKVSSLRNFADSNAIQILVINIDSFAKDENIINKANDKLNGKKPVEFIKASCPAVIVDEPQNMETDIRKKAIANLNPAFTLRYSATHRNLYNLVYKLDPVQAYDLGLVKQIEVDSVYAENDRNRGFIQIVDFKQAKRGLAVKLKMDGNTKNGVIRKLITVKNGDDLYTLSDSRDAYKDGYILNQIDAQEGFIEFSNGEVLHKGQTHGGLNDEIMKIQMEKAIEEHFKKEKQLKAKGIKILSLFFIDRVANYRTYDEKGNFQKGKFAEWFEEIYSKYQKRPLYKDVIKFKENDVHNGYFAQDKKGVFKDSSENRETKADDCAYSLIMKDKEKLLDSNIPLRFIFSHSALREGWDNPNVFQICTLNETKSDMKKRQEIGRGLRLCVDQNGNRIFDKNINKLTVVANESYDEFAQKLQKEMEEDCGVKFTGRIKNKNKRVKIKFRKGFDIDPKFIKLWDKIKHKTTYRVKYETEELIKNAAKAVKNMPEVKKPVIKVTRTKVEINPEAVTGNYAGESIANYGRGFKFPDILGYIQSKTELTRITIGKILKKSGRISDIMLNPQMFLDFAVGAIKHELYELMIDGIKYEKIAGQKYEMMLFSDKDVETYKDNLYEITKTEKTIADHIIFESEVERKFAEDCENSENIEFFIKLPNWFVINTPIGTYNPDWALIYKNENRIYFVAETKSTTDLSKLRPQERLKIKCGKAKFKEFSEVKFKHVTKVSELV